MDVPARGPADRNWSTPAATPIRFASRIGAEDELDHIRRLLDLAGRDQKRLTEIGDMVQAACRHAAGLPDIDTIRQRLRSDSRLTGVPTLAEYLPIWLHDIEVDDNTRSSYACHIQLHLIPYLGDIVLDKLRPHHVQT